MHSNVGDVLVQFIVGACSAQHVRGGVCAKILGVRLERSINRARHQEGVRSKPLGKDPSVRLGPWLTPPTHIRKFFFGKKNDIYQRGRKWAIVSLCLNGNHVMLKW